MMTTLSDDKEAIDEQDTNLRTEDRPMTRPNEFSALCHEIESLVDTHGVYTVLSAIQEICYAKAEHVRDNWQDRPLAKLWDKVGKALSPACVAADQLP
jgi:hypothetical protein